MANALPARITNDLIVRLNALRKTRSSDWGNSLDQVSFKARGLRNSSPSGYLAVSSMVAALAGDAETVRVCYADIKAQYPHCMPDVMNTVRSLIAVRDYETARLALNEFLEEADTPHQWSFGCYSLLGVGALSDANSWSTRLASYDQSRRTHSVSDTLALSTSLFEAGVTDAELRLYIESMHKELRALGWKSAILSFNNLMGQEPTAAAIARVLVDAEPDEVLDVEDAVMHGMFEAGDRLYREGVIVTAVVSATAYV